MSERAGWSVEEVRAFMEEHIPFNKLLGLRARTLTQELVEILMPFRAELIGDPLRPALHGGTLSALIDTAGGAAAFLHVAAGDRLSTVDLVVDYLSPGPPADVVAQARVVRRGNRVCIANVQVVRADDTGGVIAQGRGVYNIVRSA